MSTFLILFKQDIRTYGLLDIKLLLHSDFRYKYILVGWEEGTSFLLILRSGGPQVDSRKN